MVIDGHNGNHIIQKKLAPFGRKAKRILMHYLRSNLLRFHKNICCLKVLANHDFNFQSVKLGRFYTETKPYFSL